MAGEHVHANSINQGTPIHSLKGAKPTSESQQNSHGRGNLEGASANNSLKARDESLLEHYARRGHLTVTQDRTDAAKKLVREWVRDGGIEDPEKLVILTQTSAESNRFNQFCQRERLREGALSSESIAIHKREYHIGDRVMFHQNLLLKGVKHGDRGTLTGIDSLNQNVTVKLDRTPSKLREIIGHRQTVTIGIKELSEKQFTLGYASTPCKLRGTRVETAYCLTGGKITNNVMDYVQVTRSKSSVKIFAQRDHVGKALAEIADSAQQSQREHLYRNVSEERRLSLRISRDEKGR